MPMCFISLQVQYVRSEFAKGADTAYLPSLSPQMCTCVSSHLSSFLAPRQTPIEAHREGKAVDPTTRTIQPSSTTDTPVLSANANTTNT